MNPQPITRAMNYYLLLSRDQQRGPLTKNQLLDAGMVSTSLVWHEGLTDWKQAQEIPELADLFPTLASLGSSVPELPPPVPDDLLPAIPDPDSDSMVEDDSDLVEESTLSPVSVAFKIVGVMVVLFVSFFFLWNWLSPHSVAPVKPDLATREGVQKVLEGDWCSATSVILESFTFNPDGTLIERKADPRSSRWASKDSGYWEIRQAKFTDTRKSFYYIKAGVNFFAFRVGYPDELIDITFKGFNNTMLEEDQYGIALEEYKINLAHSYDKYQRGTCGIFE